MLCKACGTPEREHDRFFDHDFVGPGKMGEWGVAPSSGSIFQKPEHNDYSTPQIGQGKLEGTPFITGMTVTTSKPVTLREGNAKFHKALDKMREVHDKKSADYANDENRYANFEYAAKFAGVTVDQVFAVLIGVKEARLLELQSSGKVPNNESIEDTLLDAAVYSVLRYSYRQ